MQKTIALIVSRVFSPSLWVIVLFFVLFFKTGLSDLLIKTLLPGALLLEIILPAGVLIYFLKTKRITDFDITDRKQRPLFFGIVGLCYVISILIIAMSGFTVFFWIKLCILGAMLAGLLITLFYKVSVHIAFNTLGVILINFLVSFYFIPLVLIIPLVAWSRYVRKKHTPGQMLAALVLMSLMIIPLMILL